MDNILFFFSTFCKLMHLSIPRILTDMIEFNFILGICIYPLYTEATQSLTDKNTVKFKKKFPIGQK